LRRLLAHGRLRLFAHVRAADGHVAPLLQSAMLPVAARVLRPVRHRHLRYDGFLRRTAGHVSAGGPELSAAAAGRLPPELLRPPAGELPAVLPALSHGLLPEPLARRLSLASAFHEALSCPGPDTPPGRIMRFKPKGGPRRQTRDEARP